MDKQKIIDRAVARTKDAIAGEVLGIQKEGQDAVKAFFRLLEYEMRELRKAAGLEAQIPKGRANDTIEDLYADDMLTSGKPWTKPRHRKKKASS